MDLDLNPVTTAVIGGLGAVVTTILGMLIPRIPLLMRALQVYINGVDATLVQEAVANAAERALQHIAEGVPMEAAIENMVEHVQRNMSKALQRLEVSREALEVKCNGELARLMVGRR